MSTNVYNSSRGANDGGSAVSLRERPGDFGCSLVGHVHGFDYARCILAIVVVALHTRVLGMSKNASFVYDHFFSLAVPCFMLISLFLFAAKGKVNGRNVARRVERLVLLFIFWSVVYAVVFHKSDEIVQACHSMTGLIRTAIEGGNSIFYFFSCLAFVTFVTAFACRLGSPTLWTLAIASTCGLWVMSSLAGHRLSEEFANYYNPLNFIPYAFVAPIIAAQVRDGALRSSAAKKMMMFTSILTIWAALTLLEMRCLPAIGEWSPSAYSRPSAVFGAVFVVKLFLLISHPAPRVVRWLADCSLGIYCVHIFVKESVRLTAMSAHFSQHFAFAWSAVSEIFTRTAQFTTVLVLSIVIVAFLRHALARQMI
jgi:hypothetical protein